MKKIDENITPNTYNGNAVGTNEIGYSTGYIGTYVDYPCAIKYNHGTSNYNLWSYPELINVIENNDSIEMIYKETSMICHTSFPAPPPEVRVFKYIFSCVDGKWNKSDRIYGRIIPASDESYEFE